METSVFIFLIECSEMRRCYILSNDVEEFLEIMEKHRCSPNGIRDCLNCEYFKLNNDEKIWFYRARCTNKSEKGFRIVSQLSSYTDGRPRNCPLNTSNDILQLDIKKTKECIESLKRTIVECNKKIEKYEQDLKEMEAKLCTE
jgi:Sec7-like guanine-nucleotide exchange factor